MSQPARHSLLRLLSRTRLLVVFAFYVVAFVGVTAVIDAREADAFRPAAFSDAAGSSASASFERNCSACHIIGGKGLGPDLRGVIGRKAGSLPGYQYSEAMRARNVLWSKENIHDFLKQPDAFVPGTSMSVSSIREDEISKIIEYLDSL